MDAGFTIGTKRDVADQGCHLNLFVDGDRAILFGFPLKDRGEWSRCRVHARSPCQLLGPAARHLPGQRSGLRANADLLHRVPAILAPLCSNTPMAACEADRLAPP